MSGGLHWDQPAPRQWNTAMAGNPRNPAMSPHKQSSRHLSHWAKQWKKEKGEGGGQKETGRITPSSATKTASIRHAETRYNTGGTELALPTANHWPLDKYQLLFVVNLVKLHLTACSTLWIFFGVVVASLLVHVPLTQDQTVSVQALAGTLCCVLMWDTSLSQCLSPPRCTDKYLQIEC